VGRRRFKFGGHTERYTDEAGPGYGCAWVPAARGQRRAVRHARSSAIAVNSRQYLRLWRAEAPESFDFSVSTAATTGRGEPENHLGDITKVLYPNDEQVKGKELRLAAGSISSVACSLA